MPDGAGPYRVRVLSCCMVTPDICELEVDFPPGVTAGAQPGQFADFLIPDDAGYHQLRRPFSVAWLHPDMTSAVFYFRRQGAGTARLAACREGEMLNVLFPLGRGYSPPQPGERIWAVGGGTGVAAILPMRSVYGASVTLFAGFRSPGERFGKPEMLEGAHIAYDTEGSTAVSLLERELRSSAPPDRIVACGPVPMYRALKRAISGIAAEVSLEERMGCGTGGCQACVAGVGGKLVRTCTDGPVFALREVDELAD